MFVILHFMVLTAKMDNLLGPNYYLWQDCYPWDNFYIMWICCIKAVHNKLKRSQSTIFFLGPFLKEKNKNQIFLVGLSPM